MNIAHEMSFVIQRAGSLEEILESAVALILREMSTDVCSIYLLDPRDHRLHLMATHGLEKKALGKVSLELGEGLTGIVVKEMRSLAVDDASAHPGYRYFPETREERFRSYLGVPLAMRQRPVGAIVVQTRGMRSYSNAEIQALSAISGQLAGVVENARLIHALEHGEAGVNYLEGVRTWRSLGKVVPAAAGKDLVLKGTPASRGIAIGSAFFCGTYDQPSGAASLPFQGVEEEVNRVHRAFEQTRDDILRIRAAAEREAGEEHAMIFSSHLLLLNDAALAEKIAQRIESGKNAYQAIHASLDHFMSRMQNVPDPYIQERVEDFRDLQNRLLGNLDSPVSGTPTMTEKIVISSGIPPSLVVELKAAGARGIVSERGGPTSHGMLLARSMGLPAVTGIVDTAHLIHPDETVVVDGTRGEVIVSPSEETVSRHESAIQMHKERQQAARRFKDLPARTRDGIDVTVRANVGVTADLALAVENGADGIGLYRTEFPFIIREDLPTRDEQVLIYSKAYETFPRGPVVFRLLDLGGDKFISRDAVARDRGPFSAFRSIRLLLQNPRILREQVQAFAIAAGLRPLSFLIPMVTSLDEIRATLKHAREAIAELEGNEIQRSPSIGAMIEVPAAVALADEIARETDFLSIGSNDLAQYTLAVDREDSRAAGPSEAYHPAMLRLVRQTIEAGIHHGKKVTLCGELAGNWRLALLFAAMGLDAISVSPAAIPALKQAFTQAEIGKLRDNVPRILELGDATDVEKRLRELLPAQDSY